MKKFHFLVGTTTWGVQDPHELIRYCSPTHILCVLSHFWPFTKANLVLENFNKNLGFGQTPRPLLGQMPNFFRICVLRAPLSNYMAKLVVWQHVIWTAGMLAFLDIHKVSQLFHKHQLNAVTPIVFLLDELQEPLVSSRNQRESRFSRILKNIFEISLLDLEVFQFHLHFSKRVKLKTIALFISQKEGIFFHFIFL